MSRDSDALRIPATAYAQPLQTLHLYPHLSPKKHFPGFACFQSVLIFANENGKHQ